MNLGFYVRILNVFENRYWYTDIHIYIYIYSEYRSGFNSKLDFVNRHDINAVVSRQIVHLGGITEICLLRQQQNPCETC